MGKDSPALQISKSDKDKIDDDICIDGKSQFESNSSNKGSDYQSISDIHKNDSPTTIDGYGKHLFHDWKSSDFDKDINTQKDNQQFIGNDDKQVTFTENDSSLYAMKRYIIATNRDRKFELRGKCGSIDTNPIDVAYIPLTFEHTERANSEIDTRIFQKKEYHSQELNKNVTSSLDKCSWDKESEEVSDQHIAVFTNFNNCC